MSNLCAHLFEKKCFVNFVNFLLMFLICFPIIFSRFDTSESMIPLSVSEISALAGFCDEKQDEEHEQELDNAQKLISW